MVQRLKNFHIQRATLVATLIYIFLQVCKTGAKHCKAEQYSVLKANKFHSCQDCPRCGAGWEPSPPCDHEASIHHNNITKVRCKRCVLGETFSDNNSTEECKYCGVCNPDQVVISNCTLKADIKCDKKCKSIDTYFDTTTDDCHKCSMCCGLASDKQEQECVNKGMPSDQQCNVNTATRCKTKPSMPSLSTLVYSSNEKSVQPLNSTQPTITKNIPLPKRESLPTKYSTDDESNTERIIFIAVLSCLVVVLLLIFIKWIISKRRCPYKTQILDGNSIESKSGSLERNETTYGISEYLLLDKRKLNKLCEVPEYHNICLLLECKPQEIKPKCGDYTDVARHYSLKYEEICCLSNNKPGERADAFFRLLLSRLPNLTVEEFVIALTIKNINRKDVVKLLDNCIYCSN